MIFGYENTDHIQIFFGSNYFFIEKQPYGNPEYISNNPNYVTEFYLTEKYNSIGIISHNYINGNTFFEIKENESIYILSSNAITEYKVVDLLYFQALSPNSPYSSFKNLETNELISYLDLFKTTYMLKNHLILQTCIEKYGLSTWGRFFVIAFPINYYVIY